MAKRRASSRYTFLVPGRGYAHTADRATDYREKVRECARRVIPEPLQGDVEIRLDYLCMKTGDRLDGDNLLKTVCDALKGVAYQDDSQITRHSIRRYNRNSNFEIRAVPLTLQLADLLERRESFTIVRLSKASLGRTTEPQNHSICV